MLFKLSPGSLPARLQHISTVFPYIYALGDAQILENRTTAFFCSAQCSGAAILRSLETARRWRDQKQTIIGGFHSPIEKEVLRILLKGGDGKIVVCPARSLEKMRLPIDWENALEQNRLLILSTFADKPRQSRNLAVQRNRFVAHLADRILVAHHAPGGSTEKLVTELRATGKAVEHLTD